MSTEQKIWALSCDECGERLRYERDDLLAQIPSARAAQARLARAAAQLAIQAGWSLRDATIDGERVLCPGCVESLLYERQLCEDWTGEEDNGDG